MGTEEQSQWTGKEAWVGLTGELGAVDGKMGREKIIEQSRLGASLPIIAEKGPGKGI